ncbi:hypothetical protein ES702_01406 [subsurface metagenome]
MSELTKCDVLDEQGRYKEAIICYVTEYQPAKLKLGDPSYPTSQKSETLQIRRVTAPASPAIGILIILGLALVLIS